MKRYKIVIHGGHPLSGGVTVAGAKNAALPQLAAVALTAQPVQLENLPQVEDIRVLVTALQGLGAESELRGDALHLHLPRIAKPLVPADVVRTTRASILLLGPLLARSGYAQVSLPGGCSIGDRKIDFHLQGLEKMGADISLQDDYIIARCQRLHGIEYEFPSKTVTGTENLLMAATLAEGTTLLGNCALEPEIGDLIELLSKMGADIHREDGGRLRINGKTSLGGASHRLIPDRIEAGTYVIAGCFPGHRLQVRGLVVEHISSLLAVLQRLGAHLQIGQNCVEAQGSSVLRPAQIVTEPYPGFPTDLQAQLTTLLTQADGISCVRETIFNDRFKHVAELNRLGADIEVAGDSARIRGPTPLHGAVLTTTDLRASAALVLGGLIARGETIIGNAYQLFRGYDHLPRKLQEAGADIRIEEEA